jgi:hypothetical protein
VVELGLGFAQIVVVRQASRRFGPFTEVNSSVSNSDGIVVRSVEVVPWSKWRSKFLQSMLAVVLGKPVRSSCATPYYQAYIDCLPRNVDNVLAFDARDFEVLRRASPSTFVRCVGFLRTAVRQYCHLSELVKRHADLLPALEWTWFKWAMTIVMSRQNVVPRATSGRERSQEIALIPLWDFINHSAILNHTTAYDSATHSLVFVAPEDVAVGGEVILWLL